MAIASLSVAVLSLTVCAGAEAGSYTDLSDAAEPWLKAKVGAQRVVPYPFQPLRRHGAEVSCWGRVYTLSGVLPTQVTSQDAPLLAGPIRLVVERGGKTLDLPAPGPTFVSEADDRIEFTTRIKAGDLEIELPGRIEYDGLIDVDLTLKAAKPTEIGRLSIQIPMAKAASLFYHLSTQWGRYEYGRVDELPEAGLALPWQAYWWVGDHRRGLAFVTETAGGWTGPAEKAFRLQRTPAGAVLTANLINEPTKLTGTRRFRIGLQATPGKPLPTGWHGRHVGRGHVGATPGQARELVEQKSCTVALMWNDTAKYFSYPEPKDPDAFRQAVKTYHDAGVRCVYYITLSSTALQAPVFQRHFKEWLMTRPDGQALFGHNAQDVDLRTTKVGDWASACPASTFADWLVWAVDRAMADYDLDGVYIDNPGPYYCLNTRHGCATRGAVTHPYFATRDLQKRLYAVVHGRKPKRGIVWEHNSRTSNSLNLTFCDIYSDGEHFRVRSKGRPEQCTRTYLDIAGTGRQWGAQPCLLCSALNVREEYTTWLAARLLPFGNAMFVHEHWMDFSALAPALRARREFGLGEQQVEWFTPDKPPAWLAVSPADLVVGAYVRPDKHALVTISNLTDKKLAARIKLAPMRARLGRELAIHDALTGARCYPIGRQLVLAVPANTFRMIRLAPRASKE